jgi:hypothetical protein
MTLIRMAPVPHAEATARVGGVPKIVTEDRLSPQTRARTWLLDLRVARDSVIDGVGVETSHLGRRKRNGPTPGQGRGPAPDSSRGSAINPNQHPTLFTAPESQVRRENPT